MPQVYIFHSLISDEEKALVHWSPVEMWVDCFILRGQASDLRCLGGADKKWPRSREEMSPGLFGQKMPSDNLTGGQAVNLCSTRWVSVRLFLSVDHQCVTFCIFVSSNLYFSKINLFSTRCGELSVCGSPRCHLSWQDQFHTILVLRNQLRILCRHFFLQLSNVT